MGPSITALSILLVLSACEGSTRHNLLVQEALTEQAASNKPQVGVVLESHPRADSNSVGINWNRVLDLILDLARKDILRQGLDSVDLPDIQEEFKDKVLLIPVKGEFTATEGSLGSLSTVQRTGEAHVTREGASLLVSCELGLATLSLKYGHYRARVRHVGSVSGHVKGSVGRNSVRVTARVDLGQGGQCTASLTEVKVLQLEGLQVKVSGSGFGPLNWLITKATNSYAKNHRGDIIAKVEEGLRTEIGKAVSKFDCQQYTTLLLL